MSPFISEAVWNKSLRLAGFSGYDIVLHSPQDRMSSATTIISTAIAKEAAAYQDNCYEVPHCEKLLWLVSVLSSWHRHFL
jgi:hypothetical protein